MARNRAQLYLIFSLVLVCLLCSRHCLYHNNTVQLASLSHFICEDTHATKGQMICPRLHDLPVPPQETLKHSSVSVSGGVSGSWCTQGLFEPSERLWWVWALILNVISLLLPPCWGFSFALGVSVTPALHSCHSKKIWYYSS